MPPQPRFVEFPTADGLTLPGLLYRARPARAVLIYLHGNGNSSIFYDHQAKARPLAEALAGKGISTLFFNNRGADIIKKLYVRKGRTVKRRRYGMAYERIKECIPDIEGAVSFLEKLGYRKFYLAGTSTGANKICVYNFYKPKNPISKYVLIAGGDDVGIYYNLLGKAKFWKLLKQAKREVKAGRGENIITGMLPDYIFSNIGFAGIADPDGDYNIFPFLEALRGLQLSRKPLFRHFRSIRKPTLAIYGDHDEYTWNNTSRVVEILKQHQPSPYFYGKGKQGLGQPQFDYRIIRGADHGFKGKERLLAKTVADWCAATVN